MITFEFAFAMGLACFFIGFFFGHVTKKYAKKKNDSVDVAEISSIPPDETFIPPDETFLVDVKTGKYSFRGDLIKKYGRKGVFHMLAYGELVHEDKWLEMKKKNECKTYEDVVKREG